ncbi:COP9 signalosome complex subunit 1 [Drosophila bipectinata]|uniref:COP9 signalosome complex subunit 1 n=1 Tax=Drosophila bipectinata TaxID=42026 RepID=UPI0007E70A1F|nr:COP9 signalosome complex subunit 1 [Drosophila bipectinata]
MTSNSLTRRSSADNEQARCRQVENAALHLPSYADRYTDIPRLTRLKFIAQVCPKLRVPALELAIDHVKTTYNVKLYDELYKTLCAEVGALARKQPANDDEASTSSGRNRRAQPYDTFWVEDNTIESSLMLQELDAELNFKKSNSGSANVRRILEEIGDYHEKSGNLQMAIKFYARARPYCTSSDNVINMFRNLIRVSIYMANWWYVLTYIDEAKQYAFGYENLSQEVPARLSCAAGLANMGLKIYKSAAQSFLQTSFGRYDYDKIVAPEDLSFYAGLCALATYDREKLQLNVINSEAFKPFFQLTPKMWNILAKFYEGQSEVCEELLREIEDQIRLDVYLAPHVDKLYEMIINRLPKKKEKKAKYEYLKRYSTTSSAT